ncbi:MAG TPA: amidohydrolase family protein [Bacteroidia bacterium]|nr:amidohydrolase family protein [Bacteroidia bacterium]
MNYLRTFLLTVFLLASFFTNAQKTFPVNGVDDERHITYAFRNAKIFIDYKTVLDTATLLVRDGKILDAGKNVKIPGDAVVYDLQGKIIYPSFIDIFSDYGINVDKKIVDNKRAPQFLSNTKGAYGWNQAIRPEMDAVKYFNADEKKAEELRNLGFGAVLSHNKDGIARGSAVFVATGNGKENDLIIKDKAAACYSFDKGSSSQDYPSSLMGSIALLRQTYLDAQWYKEVVSPLPPKAEAGGDVEYNISLDAWNNLQTLPQVFEVKDKLSVLRADKIGDEFQAKYIIKGNGDEYQRINEIKATNDPLIIPVNFPDPYDMSDPYDALNITLSEMKHWEMAPANAAALAKANIPFAFTAADLKEKKDFLKNIIKAISYGLTEEQALKACTKAPAEILGVDNVTGSLNKGMIADFIITSKNIFEKDNVIYENWVQGKRYIVKNYGPKDIRGNYELLIDNMKPLQLAVTGEAAKQQFNIQEDTAKTNVSFSFSQDQYNLQFELKKNDPKGIVRLTGTIENDSLKILGGNGQLADGTWIKWKTRFVSEYKPIAKKDTAKIEKPTVGDLLYPNMAYGFKELPTAKNVLIKNATVWTNEAEGILQNTDVLIQNGKIARVGKNIDASAIKDVQTVDGTGKHVSAGIIDEHSHIAISGDVNECTQSVTSEVRIGDVVDCDDVNTYRQLSGGVTCSHLLHGSCNPVGGQTQLIKLRWGHNPEEMKFAGSDGFIKFALGENVKQSNWGDNNVTRYPQTRMGVEQVYVNAFTRAREYEHAWKNYKSNPKLVKPRKDLELEALQEILNAKRFITCHSYEQSEINMLMHVADTFHFRVNTFTHILEGYKVADKMKKHGAGGSSFADWWAYKFEVYEAIPYNGKIMHDMGVTVAYNSDDAEMARRLNQEAAKAVMYGGVSEQEALKFVTLNPAKLLHIDNRTGSIKVGKDADVVVWSDNPLSIYARVLQTYVDGVRYFDEETDKANRDYISKERARLIQKMNAEKNKGATTQKPSQTLQVIKHCNDEETVRP